MLVQIIIYMLEGMQRRLLNANVLAYHWKLIVNDKRISEKPCATYGRVIVLCWTSQYGAGNKEDNLEEEETFQDETAQSVASDTLSSSFISV